MRTLARGLEVLDFIARRNGVSFTEVADAAGLSKSVTHRILAELVRSGFAWRGQADRLYHAAPFIDATPGGSYATLLRSVSAEPMSRLIAEISWPSDLFVRDGTYMVMVDSNRPSSPFRLPWSRIGRRAPILLSSVGRAVLACMTPEERNAIYDELRSAGDWRSQVAWLKRPIEETIRQVQTRGYAERELAFAGPMFERYGITSIAMAINVRGVVPGALNVWWPVSADPRSNFPKRYVSRLRACVAEIARNLRENRDATEILTAPTTERERPLLRATRPRRTRNAMRSPALVRAAD